MFATCYLEKLKKFKAEVKALEEKVAALEAQLHNTGNYIAA